MYDQPRSQALRPGNEATQAVQPCIHEHGGFRELSLYRGLGVAVLVLYYRSVTQGHSIILSMLRQAATPARRALSPVLGGIN